MKLSTASPPLATEADIQKAIVAYLVARSWVVVRINSSSFKGEANNYIRGYTIGGTGASSGFPDVTAYHADGRFLLIEVKREKGKLSPSQEKFHDFAMRRGVPIHVVRDPRELDAILAPRAFDAQGEER